MTPECFKNRAKVGHRVELLIEGGFNGGDEEAGDEWGSLVVGCDPVKLAGALQPVYLGNRLGEALLSASRY